MHTAADRIRNVALVGHRGAARRRCTRRCCSRPACSRGWARSPRARTVVGRRRRRAGAPDVDLHDAAARSSGSDRKINLIDTPGEPSFVADALGALRVCESAVFVVNAVMGAEVTTTAPVEASPPSSTSRGMLFVNMLDRERADFYRTLESLKAAFGPHVVATEIPIGAEHEDQRRDRPRRHEGLRVRRRRHAATRRDRDPRASSRAQAQEYREKLMDEVAEVSDALMERYLEGDEISHEEIVDALKERHQPRLDLPRRLRRGDAQPRHQPPARRDRRGPALAGQARSVSRSVRSRSSRSTDRELFAYVFKTRADPVRRADQPAARLPGRAASTTRQVAQHARPRQGAHRPADRLRGQAHRPRPTSSAPATSARVAKLKETRAGDWLAARDEPVRDAHRAAPRPRHGFRDRTQERRAMRTRSSRRCAACRRRIRRSTCTATRRPASRSSPASRRFTSR